MISVSLGNGALDLKAAGNLDVVGPVTAKGGITLTSAGTLSWGGNLDAGASTLALATTGNAKTITQVDGRVTAGTLTLSTVDANATLNDPAPGNAIANLGLTTLGAGALSLKNSSGLTISGAVTATVGITIQSKGPLAINNSLQTGATLKLTTTGAGTGTITQSGAGALSVKDLQVTTDNSDATLTSTGIAINDVATLLNTNTGTSGNFS